jgi:hypothetical protein
VKKWPVIALILGAAAAAWAFVLRKKPEPGSEEPPPA